MITTVAAAASTCSSHLTWPDVVALCVGMLAVAVVFWALFR